MIKALALLGLAWPLCAPAQAVWRCGPDGRVYADRPCAEGRQLEPLAARPAADVAAAKARAGQEAQAAASLRRTRLAEEARLRGNGLAAIPAPARAISAAPKPASMPPPRKRRPPSPADDGIWRAVVPASPPAPG